MPRLNTSRTRARAARRTVLAQAKQRRAARRRGEVTTPRSAKPKPRAKKD